jgi:hypothetical protein
MLICRLVIRVRRSIKVFRDFARPDYDCVSKAPYVIAFKPRNLHHAGIESSSLHETVPSFFSMPEQKFTELFKFSVGDESRAITRPKSGGSVS